MNPIYQFTKTAGIIALLVVLLLPSQLFAQCDGDYLPYDGVAFNWVDISGTGTLVASGDDVSSVNSVNFTPVTLGYIFTFFDVPYTSVNVSSNGYISTSPDDAGPDLSNDCPIPAAPSTGGGARVYPLHDDLIADVWYQFFPATPVPHPGGTIPNLGASIFQWNATHFGGCSTEEFQVVLFTNGDILFQYNQTCEGGSGATIGLQNEPLTAGVTYACNSAGSIGAGDAVIFYYSAPADATTPPTVACADINTPNSDYPVITPPAFAWNDISGTGTLVASGDDASSISSGILAPVTLGAPFPLYGSPFTQLVPTSNGYITTDLSDAGPDLSNDCPLPAIPSTPFGTNGIRIYPLHDDLISDVYYQYFAVAPLANPAGVMGASVFQWEGTHFGGCGGLRFQAWLYDDGTIVYVYDSVCENGSGSTAGIQDGAFSRATTIFCDTPGAVSSGSTFALGSPVLGVGECEAFVEVPPPTLMDACGTSNVYYFNDYNFTQDASDIYPIGTSTTVTWYVWDLASGLSATCSFDVDIPSNTGAPVGGWQEAAIGGSNGSSSQGCDGYIVDSGNGFSTPFADKGYFVYQELCGNSSITVEITDWIGIGGWAGIQIRESLMAGSKKVAMKTQLGNFIRRDVRAQMNGFNKTKQYPVFAQEEYLRLTRTDYGFGMPNYFIGEYSVDGTNWVTLFQTFVMMNDCVLLGMFAEDTNVNSNTIGIFNNPMVTGSLPTPITAPSAGHTLTAQAAEVELSVYPNPTTDLLNVSMEAFAGQAVSMKIFNKLGQEVSFRQISEVVEFTEVFDVSDFDTGLYTISIYADGQVSSKRFLVGQIRP